MSYKGSGKMTKNQCPLALAWVSAVRKVQDITLPRVVVSLESFNQK